MKNQFLIASLCMGACILTGCKHTKPMDEVYTEQTAEMTAQMSEAADTKLVEAASSVSSSLHQLAEIEQAALPAKQVIEPPDPASYGMDGLASIDWNGPIEPLVFRVAKASNYKLKILGTEPAVPVIVSIMKKNVALADILRDAGLQAGSRANIVVFPATHVIELRYAMA